MEGQPQTLGLVELLRVYVAHRLLVVTRRSQYRLTKRRERLHLVEGLLKAIVDIDEVIALMANLLEAWERIIGGTAQGEVGGQANSGVALTG